MTAACALAVGAAFAPSTPPWTARTAAPADSGAAPSAVTPVPAPPGPAATSSERATPASVPALEMGTAGPEGTARRRAGAAPPVLPAPEAAPRPVYVALVVPRGAVPDPAITPASVRDAVDKASSYWSGQSRGTISFEVVATTGWDPSSRPCTDINGLWQEAQARLPASGGPRRHLLVVVPPAAAREGGCEYGFGSLGSRDSGGSVYAADLAPTLLAHELGHTLGLGHANALLCTGEADAAWSSGWPTRCTPAPYDDLWDVMGYSGAGFGEGMLNGVHLDHLGTDPDAFVDVRHGAHEVDLAPLASQRGRRVARVHDPDGPVYYLELRTDTGEDGRVARSSWRPETGVRVLRPDPAYADTTGSYELDASPGRGRRYDRALPVGQTFVSASGRVRVTLTDLRPDAAALRILIR